MNPYNNCHTCKQYMLNVTSNQTHSKLELVGKNIDEFFK